MTLEIGYNHPIEFRNYSYPFGPLAGKRIVYVSDLHYHLLSHRRVSNNIQQVRRLKPDIILLGGDYVDTPLGLPHFQRFVASIGAAPIFAIAGNHDKPYLHRIRRIVEKAGATWIHNKSAILQLGMLRISIDGTRPALAGPHEQSAYLSDLSILCLHQPIDVAPLAHRYNLIFAGHLHGGQIVLWQTPAGLYPVRWAYRWNQLALQYGACRYLISKGLGDTLPIRYDCRRDVIVINFEPEQNTL